MSLLFTDTAILHSIPTSIERMYLVFLNDDRRTDTHILEYLLKYSEEADIFSNTNISIHHIIVDKCTYEN